MEKKLKATYQHISRQFDEEMDDIRHKVLTMGGLVEQQLDLATNAFINQNMRNAGLVVGLDQQVNELEKYIDHECTEIMVRRQPAASDLRMLVATIKMITDLERIGDEAVRIARTTLRMETYADYPGKFYEIEPLLALVKQMLKGALDAYARSNIDEVLKITAQDAKVDREYATISRQLIGQMMESPGNIARSLDILWAARALELIGDHACNVCEQVIYVVKGKDVRHISRDKLIKVVKSVR